MAKERRDGGHGVGWREAGNGWRRRERLLLGFLGGLLLGLGAVLEEVLASPDATAAEGHAFDPRQGLVVGAARDVRLLVLVFAGLGLGGVGHGLERGHEGGEAIGAERVGVDADGGEELLKRLVLVGGDAVGDEAEAFGGRRRGRVDLIDLLAARAPAEDGGEQGHRGVEAGRRRRRPLEVVDLAHGGVLDGDEVDHVDLGRVAQAGGRRHVALDCLVLPDVVLKGFEGELGATGDSVADHAGVLRGDQRLVLGVGVRGSRAEGDEELVATPVSLVDELVRGDGVPECVCEGGEQLAVFELHGVLGQDGGVLELGGNLREVRRDHLLAVEGRADGFRGGVVGGHALDCWWAGLLEAVAVLDLLGDDVRTLESVYGELAVGEDGGVVLEEGLEEALALVELADLEDETLEVGVVVVRPNDWSAVGGDGNELVGDVG